MTFAELRAEVIRITNRPELVAEIDAAINAAILKFHRLDDFWRDRIEGVLNFPSADFQHSTALAAFPQFRKVSRVSPLSIGNIEGRPLALLTDPGDAFCVGCVRKTNVYWMSGDTIYIRVSERIQNFRFSYFANPTILPVGTYSGWLAAQHPYAIIDEAASRVFGSISYVESQNFYASKVGLVHSAGGPTGHCKEILMAQLYPQDQ